MMQVYGPWHESMRELLVPPSPPEQAGTKSDPMKKLSRKTQPQD
jgi:hypothetical protein